MSNTSTTVSTRQPSLVPTRQPSLAPTRQPSLAPTRQPSLAPTRQPSLEPAASTGDLDVGSHARLGPVQTTTSGGAVAPSKTRSSCTIKRRAKVTDTPKERLLKYRVDLQKVILSDAIEVLKQVQAEHEELEHKREELLSEQRDLLCEVRMALAEYERRKREDDVQTVQQMDEISKFIWTREKINDTIVRKMKDSLQRMESEILRKERNNEWLRSYRDDGRFEHEKRIASLKEQRKEANSNFKKVSDRITQEGLKAHEEIDHATSAAIANNQCAATENSIAKMTRSDQVETMENHSLRREKKVYQEIIESLLSETEKLTEEVFCLTKEVHLRREEELRLPRGSSMHQFSIAEDLCEDSTLETDTRTVDGVTPSTEKSQEGKDKMECRERNSVGRHHDEDTDKENKYLNRGPAELQFLKIYGRRLTFAARPTSAEGESGKIAVDRRPLPTRPDEFSHSWPVTWDMLKRFREQSLTKA